MGLFSRMLFSRYLHLLMSRLRAAPATEFLELYLAFNLLLVLVHVIITPLAGGAPESD
jgi:hypothetical protein